MYQRAVAAYREPVDPVLLRCSAQPGASFGD